MSNKRKDSSRSSAAALRRMSSSSSSTTSTWPNLTSSQTDATLMQPSQINSTMRPSPSLPFTSPSSSAAAGAGAASAAIALPASASSSMPSTVTGYDARGAALYICAVVTLYALLVLLFVAILAAVNRRHRRRKARDNEGDDDDEYDVGVGRLARYLASVSKLRELGERRDNFSCGDALDKRKKTAIAAVCGADKDYDDSYGFRSDFSWCRTASCGRHVPPAPRGAQEFSGLQTATSCSGVGLDPYLAGGGVPPASSGPVGTGTYPGPRDFHGRRRRGGSMDLLANNSSLSGGACKPAPHQTVTAQPVAPAAAVANAQSASVVSASASAGVRPVQHKQQIERRRHGNRNGNDGYWNPALKQTSPADDVITLIQVRCNEYL